MRNPYRLLVLLVLCVLSGCAEINRVRVTRLVPLSNDAGARIFLFIAFADASYPLGLDTAEQARMRWLEHWLQDNGCDPTQYTILARNSILRKHGLLGDIYELYYEVRATKCV